MNRIRGFSYSVGFIDGDGKFVPTVYIRHELIPEICKELMSLYEGHQALIEQDRAERPPRRETKDARPPWDQKVSKRDKKELQQLSKPPRQQDLSKADERSRKQREQNAKVLDQPPGD